MLDIKLKRVYNAPAVDDGKRILVDRLWPRGIKREAIGDNNWVKELAPSKELREWFHEDPENRWSEFKEKYTSELYANPAIIPFIKTISKEKSVTLLYAEKNEVHNNAIVLKEEIEKALLKLQD